MIKSAHLSKSFRQGRGLTKKLAVDDISFEVETGKVTGFLGPNGAGKSTAMRLMLGLANGKGKTTYDGKRLSDYFRPSHVVGILLEAKAFHPTRTAKRHLAVLAEAGNIPQSRVDEVLDIVGLKSEAKKKPGKFSLGMSQRLGIAAAILGKPKYLILDEPANGLDPEGMAWLRQFLKDYAKDGNGVFVSSHLLSEMSQMADNVVVIGRGKLIADTSVDKLVSGNAHNKVFVRSNKMNVLKKLLKENGLNFENEKDGVAVAGIEPDFIGQLAFKSGIPILELARQQASLEEAFLQLTADAQEFQAGNNDSETGKKKWYQR
ncbi:MAG TPA: ATP-binding cassette domain-containing protein [Candidatus Saccharimonadales bacterium]|nr:ATP-binding cassette domain-containing protein [Candidatus Saccharimonadales bacterium]